MSIFDWIILLFICPLGWLDFYLTYRQLIKLKKRVKDLENENMILAYRCDLISRILEYNELKSPYEGYNDEQ